MVNSSKPKMNFCSFNLKIIKVKMKVIIREIVENVLSRTKASFKTTRNLERPFERKKMFIQKRSKSTFSATLLALILALILGVAGFLDRPVWAAEPQYGGTITFLDGYGAAFPPSTCDPATGVWTAIYLEPYFEPLLASDIEKYGPCGTNEYPFYHSQGAPEYLLKGLLAESWSLPDEKTMIFKLRQGIMYQGKPGEMASRELTAEDVVSSYKRNIGLEARWGQYKEMESITATDK